MKFTLFFFPYIYSTKTRFPSKLRFISWMLIYTIPVFFMFLFAHSHINIFLVSRSLIAITLIYTLYEIGYIFNDAETIKLESNPTMRLSSSELAFYNKTKFLIYSWRFSLAIILSILLVVKYHTTVFVAIVWLIIPTYIAYNHIRSRLNIPLHFILVTLRFCSSIFMDYDNVNFIIFLGCLFLFPVINTIERCTEKRFDFVFFNSFLFANKKDGRYKYYLLLALISSLGCILVGDYYYYIFLIYSLYYMVYRFSSMWVNINESK